MTEPEQEAVLEPELARLLRGPGARLGEAESSDDVAAARRVVGRFRARERRRRTIAAGSLLAFAAVVVLGIGFRLSASRSPTTAATAANGAALRSASRFAVASGQVRTAQGRGFAVKDVLDAGATQLSAGACLAGAGGRVCALDAATLRLPSAQQPQEIALLSGQISAQQLTGESGFSVRTLSGQVVLVRSALVLIDANGIMSSPPQAAASDGVPSVAAPDATAVVERTPSRAGSAPSAPPASEATASELLELARRERAARHYSEAARAYRKLEQSFPDSAEARAALVSLGQLQLGQLGQPEAALRSFRAYLSAPGQLAQEAEHGVILALQKLGRTSEERHAIESFLSRYPKSVQADALKQRLQQL